MNPKGAKPARPSLAAAFTLAEVLVAVLVLAIIATAFYAALSSGFAVVQSSREDLRATQILMQRLEAVRLCRWDQLTNSTFQEQYDPFNTTNGSAGTVYTGKVSLSAPTNVPSACEYFPNVRLVTVSVAWTNNPASKPLAHSREMQTLVARYGLQNYIYGAQ